MPGTDRDTLILKTAIAIQLDADVAGWRIAFERSDDTAPPPDAHEEWAAPPQDGFLWSQLGNWTDGDGSGELRIELLAPDPRPDRAPERADRPRDRTTDPPDRPRGPGRFSRPGRRR